MQLPCPEATARLRNYCAPGHQFFPSHPAHLTMVCTCAMRTIDRAFFFSTVVPPPLAGAAAAASHPATLFASASHPLSPPNARRLQACFCQAEHG